MLSDVSILSGVQILDNRLAEILTRYCRASTTVPRASLLRPPWHVGEAFTCSVFQLFKLQQRQSLYVLGDVGESLSVPPLWHVGEAFTCSISQRLNYSTSQLVAIATLNDYLVLV
jgi:hypothetical protein